MKQKSARLLAQQGADKGFGPFAIVNKNDVDIRLKYVLNVGQSRDN